MTLVLSLFPGIGLLDRAFEAEGFCVVRGPDRLWGGDIKTFHPPAEKFDGVIGGPPCQAFSRLRHLVRHNGYRVAEDLIPEFVRCVEEADPTWWLMENVPDAPAPSPHYYRVQKVTVRDDWTGGETRRLRAFWFGDREGRRFEVVWKALHRPDPEFPVLASGGGVPVPVALGGSGKVKRTKRAIEARKGASASGCKTEAYLALARQHTGLPADFLADAPFTVAGKIKAIGNGVPMSMGRAVAQAVKWAVGP